MLAVAYRRARVVAPPHHPRPFDVLAPRNAFRPGASAVLLDVGEQPLRLRVEKMQCALDADEWLRLLPEAG